MDKINLPKWNEMNDTTKQVIVSCAASAAFAGAKAAGKWWKNRIKSGTVLELILKQDTQVVEVTEPPLWGRWPGEEAPLVVWDILECLEIATRDPKITGLVLNIDPNFKIGFAQLQEIVEAIHVFRKAGKTAVTFLETLMEVGSNVLVVYTLASACDSIIIPPYMGVALTSILPGAPFVKKMLDKLYIDEELTQRREYKSAANMFREETLTEPHKEQLTELIDNFTAQLFEMIAKNRGIDLEQVRNIVTDKGPIVNADEAKELKLVDQFAYPDQFYGDVLKEKFGKKHTLLFATEYLRRRSGWRLTSSKGKKKIALIFAEGAIHRGPSGKHGSGGSNSIGSSTLCDTIRQAREDKVNAIILRVNSGGGSASASDLIGRELLKAKEDNIKVIVSMSNVAASGGYMISMFADRILALPGTITGSIGVIWGKFNVRKFWDYFGITWDFADHEDNAKFYSMLLPYGERNKERMEHCCDHIYSKFKGSVASARGIENEEKMEELARGRVYFGNKCQDNKLISDEGGIMKAFDVTRDELGLNKGDKMKVQVYPKKIPTWKKLTAKPTNSRQYCAQSLNIAGGGVLGTCATFVSSLQRFQTVVQLALSQPEMQTLQQLAQASTEKAPSAMCTLHLGVTA
eukprot:TRINITY_DN21117_c0_g1_i1.p1 TRINITY_DN21117_c0_g1~~TRINITY_DN21117_c0_g1_i1.p1  ORF type:complete len:632 (-),score=72.90 TRINITY_DN21117_c0_g1_i1:259-2154(-)